MTEKSSNHPDSVPAERIKISPFARDDTDNGKGKKIEQTLSG